MSPAPATATPRSNLVTVMAKISLVMGAMGAAWAALQLFVALLLPQKEIAALADGMPVPPLFVWILTHLPLLSLLGLLSSLGFMMVAWCLLRRQPWARWAFIAIMVIGALANFASIALVQQMMDALAGLSPTSGPEAAEMQAQLHYVHATALASAWITALLFAALHGWIVWKLCTAEIRAEFKH